MEVIQTKKSAMYAVNHLFDWHTKLFRNVMVNISDKDAANRMNSAANHMAWIAGSLVYERYELAGLLGSEEKQASDELFKDHKGIQDGAKYPSLSEYQKDWDHITPVLGKLLRTVSEEKLNSPDPFDMPGGPYTFLDTLVACLDRESYCIGQLGLYRRLLGYDAMKWD